MECPPIFDNEPERLAALAQYGLNSERPLASLDPVVDIASKMFDMPVAVVNLVGSERVFFAASTGLSDKPVDRGRDVSFCAHAMAQDDVMVVNDATLDERFHDNPLVTGATKLRFYAGAPLRSPDGLPLGALCVIDNKPHHAFSPEDRARLRELARMAADRLELRRLEISTELAQKSFEGYARNSPTPVVWLEASGEVRNWNKAAAMLFGYADADGSVPNFNCLLAERDRQTFQNLLRDVVQRGSVDGLGIPETLCGLRNDGSEFLLGFALFCWNDGGRLVFNVHLQDVSSRQHKLEELQVLANTDALTGLANRIFLYRRTEEALSHSSSAAVLMIDLDGFKDVNDTLGHQVGDAILREVGGRLRQIAGNENTVARIGGDEFAVLVPGLGSCDAAVELARNIIDNIAEPFLINGQEVRVAASCGVAVAPVHSQEALQLIGDADLALFKAKTQGRAQAFLFVIALRMEAVARRQFSLELHRAVSDGEFLVHYQPQVRLKDGRLMGAEALLRWLHPQRGMLSPAAFLPALESGPLATAAGFWVLDEACAQAAYWRRNGASDLRMGVNLFGAQFRISDLVTQVTSTLARHGLPPEALELEITENIVLDNDDLTLEVLKELRELGVGIAFDDFGTGYASLDLLKRYPLTRIKVDRTFVQGILESDKDRALVRAILDMSNNFGLETIAEGVELKGHHDLLLDMGYQEGQGYLYSQPLSAADFGAFLGASNMTNYRMRRMPGKVL